MPRVSFKKLNTAARDSGEEAGACGCAERDSTRLAAFRWDSSEEIFFEAGCVGNAMTLLALRRGACLEGFFTRALKPRGRPLHYSASALLSGAVAAGLGCRAFQA
jgi:hypothetical protein